MISSKPLLSIPFLFKTESNLASENIFSNGYFFSLGRDALLVGLSKLGLKAGDCIIVPAYICYSTIKPLEDYGYIIKYVDINEKMELSIDHLEESIIKNDAKLILAAHYFGFLVDLTNVLAISKKYGLLVIEDCAHNFLSGRKYQNNKILGDAAIFSLRKTLPVNGGGVLCIKNDETYSRNNKSNIKKYSRTDLLFISKFLIFKLIIKIGFPNIYSSTFTYFKNKTRSSFGLFKLNHNSSHFFNLPYEYRSKIFNKYTSNLKYLEKVIYKNRSNFKILSTELLKNNFLLYKERLIEEEVPQVLVVKDLNAKLSVLHLRKIGVPAYLWPGKELPNEVLLSKNFPVTNEYNQLMVLLPVHIDLTASDIKKICSSYKSI